MGLYSNMLGFLRTHHKYSEPYTVVDTVIAVLFSESTTLFELFNQYIKHPVVDKINQVGWCIVRFCPIYLMRGHIVCIYTAK